MVRKVFYSFHFDNDNWRAGQVRNIGSVEGDKPVIGNRWEDVKSKSDLTIKGWIDDNLKDKSCLVVLIGERTSERKWINYEINRAWEMGKAVCGIYIHNLEDQNGKQSPKGKNTLPHHIPIFESIFSTSKYVYEDIAGNIAELVENAIRVREKY